jgi:hypothetical protein
MSSHPLHYFLVLPARREIAPTLLGPELVRWIHFFRPKPTLTSQAKAPSLSCTRHKQVHIARTSRKNRVETVTSRELGSLVAEV